MYPKISNSIDTKSIEIEEVEVEYNQSALFRANARNFNTKNKNMSHLSWALIKMLKRTEEANEKYTEEANDIRRELAETNDKGHIIEDKDTGFRYTKENAKLVDSKLRKLGKKTFMVQPYIVTELPADFEPIWLEFFVPFVIPDDEDVIRGLMTKTNKEDNKGKE